MGLLLGLQGGKGIAGKADVKAQGRKDVGLSRGIGAVNAGDFQEPATSYVDAVDAVLRPGLRAGSCAVLHRLKAYRLLVFYGKCVCNGEPECLY